MTEKLTIADIVAMKQRGEKITVLTAYDAGFAGFVDQCGIDMVLVGDSLGMVVLGYESTVPVTMDEMLHHAKAARRGVKRAILVGDMPFLSFQADIRDAIYNAGRFLKEAGCDAVKVEGGGEIGDTVRALVRAGIPVMGHLGLTPQTASQLGGFKVQGRDRDSARKLIADAKALEQAGVFAIVLECIPEQLGALVSAAVRLPTIGIGAGKDCDGQVLVTHDLLGLFEKRLPRFVKPYASLAPQIKSAVTAFKQEVKSGVFPGPEQSYVMQVSIDDLLDDTGDKAPGD